MWLFVEIIKAKMDLSIRKRMMMYNVKHHSGIRLKFGDKFLTFAIQLVPEAKASICSLINKNLLLYCGKFSTFVVVVII